MEQAKFKLGDKVVFVYDTEKSSTPCVIPAHYIQAGEISKVNGDGFDYKYDINTGGDTYTFKRIPENRIVPYREGVIEKMSNELRKDSKIIGGIFMFKLDDLIKRNFDYNPVTEGYVGFYQDNAGRVLTTDLFNTAEEAEISAKSQCGGVLGGKFIEVKQVTLSNNG